LLSTILLTAALATGDAQAPPLDATVDDVTQLQGTWEVVAATFDGDDETDTFNGEHWTFTGDELKCPSGRIRIAAGSTRLDMLNDRGCVFTGVYRIDGDKLVWRRQRHVFTFRRVPK
jgi:uncharacterized protein (TIGR03067 family)